MKERPENFESPKVVSVGEIDTRAPFQSVKDAVSLFGEGALSGERPAIKKMKPHPTERVFAKETQFHLAEKELNKLKEQLKYAEYTKAEALVELESARRTVNDLTLKLKTISESREAAVEVAEAAKSEAEKLEDATSIINHGQGNGGQKQDLESATEQSSSALSELTAAKQELAKLRQDVDASFEAKTNSSRQVEEADNAVKTNTERASELSKEISAIREIIEQVKQATIQVHEEQATLFTEKDMVKQSYKARLEESVRKLQAMKKEIDPETAKIMELRLADTVREIENLQKEMEDAKVLDVETVKAVTLELDGAKESLHNILQEESSLQSLVDSLKSKLGNLRKEHVELKTKEAETESISGNLRVRLRKSKLELETFFVEEVKANEASDGMIATLNQLSSEAENARVEAKEMKIRAEELKKEADNTKVSLEEAEKKLAKALEEVEEAKYAEARAVEQIKLLSERTSVTRSSTSSEAGAKIIISSEEYDNLSKKVEESDRLAELKVAAVMAEVEAVKAGENEALKRLEASQKEIQDMKVATQEALKRAEMAEAARKAVEGELRRWREREQKKAAETAARILAENEAQETAQDENYGERFMCSPFSEKFERHKSDINGLKKLEKRTSLAKKMSNMGGIFHRKKSQVDNSTPSYLPG